MKLLLLTSTLLLGSAPRHTISVLPLDGEVGGIWPARIDDDALHDLVIALWSAGGGRTLQVHLQRPGGAFAPRPDRTVAVKSDIIAFSIADVRPKPGEELLFFTRSACYSFSTAIEGYAGNAVKLFDWELLCDLPDPKRLLHLPGTMDLDGDGFVEVFVPGARDHAIFERRPETEGGAWAQAASFAVAPLAAGRPSRPAYNDQLRPIRSGPFEGLVVTRTGSSVSGSETLLDLQHWVPGAVLADASGNGRMDVLLLEAGAGGRRLQVFLQKAGGEFPSLPDWWGPIDGDGPLWGADLDGDGKVDLIAAEPGRSEGQVLRFYQNRSGSFESRPDQVLKLSGHGVEARPLDVDGDGRPELVVSAYEIPAGGALAGGRLQHRLLIFRPEAERLFERQPAFKHVQSYGAKEAKAIALRPSIDADLLGRSGRDLLALDEDGALVARHIGRRLSIEPRPFWRFVPEKRITGLEIVELNGDGRSDILLRHPDRLTVLVSQ